MSKNVLIISTSPRKNGNSQRLAQAFYDGAVAGGHRVEMISLCDQTINFCKGCMACHKLGHCVIQDDANAIVEKMFDADVIVFATPIYYYEMSGQMKTMIDRSNPLYETEYKFREIYFLSTAAEDEENVDARALCGLEGWIECFPKAKLKGSVFAGGVNTVGEIQDHPALQKAFEMGKAI